MEVDNGQGGAPEAAMASGMMDDMGDEDALLQQALAMSMVDNAPAKSEPTTEEKTANEDDNKKVETAATEAPMDTDDIDDDDAAMQMALAMSMQGGAEGEQQQQFQDPQFVNQLLGSLPGVDQNDPEIRNALENLNKSNQEKDNDDGDKKDKDDSEKK